ncbi:MAG: hypothetical protein A3J66_03745 [Candidatus Magasanikbacteria bacterium RIFCSPHIGHO2_02_FULL_47_14]|uniref:Glycosyltransferase 2-like domain-containing protein n=1 Tax=Candidatus Magasanikbacteria bacterium RIFCSPHIGHO2_02_FULL_47_14 TaxID=1798680 RepID=A0A1F6M0T0_9BACT|nr:MAG: hypothetical protein A3J66_03745 [Candidatus Magasanikbacteria bacterium RIFCSPHIGHO2_02_FULL_47_14]
MLSDYARYRLYEILPGVSIWATLLVAIVLSFVKPLWMIYAVIVFDVYWVLRVLNFSFYLIIAWLRFRVVAQTNWSDKLQSCPGAETKRHLIFLPVYKEEWSVVKSTIESIRTACYNPAAFVLVIAGEERAREHYDLLFSQVKTAFGASFFDIIGACHPMNLPDEIPGKGSNIHFAEKQMKKYVDQHRWDEREIIATIFDSDTICHPEYFRYLTYIFCTHPNPLQSSFQPIALYNNNIWESPAILRIMSFGTTFWMLTALARQDMLVTFSSHSMSWKTLVDVGFHDKRIVSEDSRIFYQSLLHFNGQYEVTPLYIPVSMDTVRDDSWWQSVRNLYNQQRRWAWGVEHIPYLLWEFRQKGKQMPFRKKFKWVFVEWEGKWSWCIVAVLLTLLSQLPLRVAPESIRQSALFLNTPHLLQILMTVAMLGLLLSALLSFPLLPKRPDSHPRQKYIMMLLQWILLPFSLIVASSIPAIDAVTHLMFGKYLGFNVSQKKRKVTP